MSSNSENLLNNFYLTNGNEKEDHPPKRNNLENLTHKANKNQEPKRNEENNLVNYCIGKTRKGKSVKINKRIYNKNSAHFGALDVDIRDTNFKTFKCVINLNKGTLIISVLRIIKKINIKGLQKRWGIKQMI